MPWWMEYMVRFHRGQVVLSRSVWSTVAELSLDHNWPWVYEGLMAEKEL